MYGGSDKSLARSGRKQARKHVRDARDFNNIETQAVIKFPHPPARQGAEGNSRHSDTQTLAYFLPGRAKDLSAPLCYCLTGSYTQRFHIVNHLHHMQV